MDLQINYPTVEIIPKGNSTLDCLPCQTFPETAIESLFSVSSCQLAAQLPPEAGQCRAGARNAPRPLPKPPSPLGRRGLGDRGSPLQRFQPPPAHQQRSGLRVLPQQGRGNVGRGARSAPRPLRKPPSPLGGRGMGASLILNAYGEPDPSNPCPHTAAAGCHPLCQSESHPRHQSPLPPPAPDSATP